jgi:oligoribonuclease
MTPKKDNLIWLDLEMTGLDTCHDFILEIATVVTDAELNVLAEGPVYAISQPDAILVKMDDWNVKQHTRSGLIERVKSSRVTVEEAQAETLDFVMQYVPPKKSPMCGNSICQDRRFLYRFMPKLEQYFHYRNLDVSTLKELAIRWMPDIVNKVKKESRHRALDDIYDSIKELNYYREHFIVNLS